MKISSTFFAFLVFVGSLVSNAIAEEVVNDFFSKPVPTTDQYYDPTPLPGFPGGLFRFTATFKNIDTEEQLASLAFRVRQLTGGNTLFNADEGRYGRLTSKLIARGFAWKPGGVLPAPNVTSAPALIQSNLGSMEDNFELVVREDGKLRYYFRNRKSDNEEIFVWQSGEFLPTNTVASAPAFIQSNLGGGPGNFEVMVREGDQLAHYFRRNNTDENIEKGFLPGNNGIPFAQDVQSAPALIQSSPPQGGRGNFEVVYRDSNNQLRHWFRKNDVDGLPWVEGNDGKAFGYDVKSAPALIQNRTNGNMEVVYRDGNNQLRHWFRDANSVWRPGNNGVPFGEDVQSAPALIQSKLGSQGDNLEVVVRKSDDKLHHYFRRRNPDDKNVVEWKSGRTPFAENTLFAPALIQSNLGVGGGNFEVVVPEEDGKLHHYFRIEAVEEVELKPYEEISTTFVIGLVDKDPKPFQFYVDAVGIRVPKSSKVVYLREGDDFNYKVAHETGKDVTFIVKKVENGLHRKQSIILNPKTVSSEKIQFIGEDGANMSGAELLTDWVLYDDAMNCWSTQYTPEDASLAHPNDLRNDGPFCSSSKVACKVREDLYLNDVIMEQVDSSQTLEVGQWKFNIDRDDRFDLGLTKGDEIPDQDLTKIPTKIHACFVKDDTAKAFDAATQSIEISRLRVAFGGADVDTHRLVTSRSKPNISVKNLIVEKYATPIQFGSIGYQKIGDNWTIENNEVRWNHAGGIAFGNDALVKGNYVHDNGQIGIKTGLTETPPLRGKYDKLWNNASSAQGAEVTQNVIEHNGRPDLGYLVKNEAGGTKFSKSRGLLIDRNWVKDNGGPGLWGDIDNCDMRYYCNVVDHNRNEGIVHELSYSADIAANIVRGNGFYLPRMVKSDLKTPEEPVWNSQIFIRTSSNASVHSNYVKADDEVGNGITILEENRNGGAHDYCDPGSVFEKDRYYGRNNEIFDNDIIQNILKATEDLTDDEYATKMEKMDARDVLKTADWYLNGFNGINGASLLKNDEVFQEKFWSSNSYDTNSYYLANTSGTYWNWTSSDNITLEGQHMNFATFLEQEAPGERKQEQDSNPPFIFVGAPPAPLGCNIGDSLEADIDLSEVLISVCLVASKQEDYLVNGLYGYPVSAKGTSCDVDAELSFEDKNGGLLIDGDIVLIRAGNNGYWSAESDGSLTISSSPDGTDRRFQVHKVSGGGANISDYDQIALKTVHKKWVVAEDGGGGVVRANRPVRGEWETFTFIQRR